MIQLLLHLWGDYILQSDWMAQNKTSRHFPAAVHSLVYGIPFAFVGSWWAVAVIIGTHFLIDRYRLARYVVWAKNWMAPRMLILGKEHVEKSWRTNLRFSDCDKTGYNNDTPPWLAFWLLIIADNTLHLTINYAALRWL